MVPEEEDEVEEEEEEEEEGERLVGMEQVADFASSLMAVLQCWHYRANALLFSWGSTVRCLFNTAMFPLCMLAWCMAPGCPLFLLALLKMFQANQE